MLRLYANVLLLVLLTACSTLQVQTDYDPEADFFSLQTYAWIDKPRQPTGNPSIDDNTLLDMRVHSAVDRALAARGYRLVEDGSPDFLVGYYVTLDRQTSISVINDYWGYPYYGDYYYGGRFVPYAVVYEYEKGTLILDIVNPDGRRLMWRGSVTDGIALSGSPQVRQQRMDEAVRALLEHFPPPQ